MFMSVFSNQAPAAAYKTQSRTEAMKIRFAWALAWIDLGFCLAIFTLVPNRSSFHWHSWIEKFIAPYRWEILIPLFLAVIFVTIGAYLIVDNFYHWPSDAPEAQDRG